jgi:hypothetical protein
MTIYFSYLPKVLKITPTKLFVILLLGFFLTSCQQIDKNNGERSAHDDDYKVVEIDNLYSLTLPKFMKATADLNDEASLQYQNIFKETYIIILEEPIEEFLSTFLEIELYDESISALSNYRNIQMDMIEENININYRTDPKNMLIDSYKAEMVEIDGLSEGIDEEITYFITFLEGEENLYMMMAWTLKDKKEKYRDLYRKMFNSFKLLPLQFSDDEDEVEIED